mmetsp:Transcript_12398/g.34500  ORF Transcript_12398/g.34500 Transcript_12398/m.34500 type:complete len:392 (+) Transcript_12398:1150-2325(+)
MEVVALLVRHLLVSVPLEARSEERQDGLPRGGPPVVFVGHRARRRGSDMAIGGGAQVSEGRVLPGGHQVLGDGVHGHGQLHEEGAVEVGVRADDEALALVDTLQPVPDLWSLGQQVAPRVLRQGGLALRPLGLLERKGQGSRRVLRDADKLLPDVRPVDVHGDHVRAVRHEELKRSHGGRRAKHHKVEAAQVEPRLGSRHLVQSVATRDLDDALAHPPIDLHQEVVPSENFVLVGNLVLVLSFDSPLALDRPSCEGVRLELAHGRPQRHGPLVPDEHHVLVKVVQARVGNVESILLALGGSLHVLHDVLCVPLPPLWRVRPDPSRERWIHPVHRGRERRRVQGQRRPPVALIQRELHTLRWSLHSLSSHDKKHKHTHTKKKKKKKGTDSLH